MFVHIDDNCVLLATNQAEMVLGYLELVSVTAFQNVLIFLPNTVKQWSFSLYTAAYARVWHTKTSMAFSLTVAELEEGGGF